MSMSEKIRMNRCRRRRCEKMKDDRMRLERKAISVTHSTSNIKNGGETRLSRFSKATSIDKNCTLG